jgi:hypothetical protein
MQQKLTEYLPEEEHESDDEDHAQCFAEEHRAW